MGKIKDIVKKVTGSRKKKAVGASAPVVDAPAARRDGNGALIIH